MNTPTSNAKRQPGLPVLAVAVTLFTLACALPGWAFPISQVVFKNDAPFKGTNNVHSLTSSDGLLTVAGWADLNQATPANLYQWWWIFGVNSGTGNGALIDGQECMTLSFDKTVGASAIIFLYTGNSTSSNTPTHLTISGFLSNPAAFAITAKVPRIYNLNYANGALTFDYYWDAGGDYGQLFFANPAASAGQTLKISVDPTSGSAALYSVNAQEVFGESQVNPVNVGYNLANTYTTPDGALTVSSFADLTYQDPTNFGTYLDQCFGAYGGANNGGIDGTETVTLQFAPGYGLSHLESDYSSVGQVSIYGFASDPGFTDPANGSAGVTYDGNGLLTFYPTTSGHVSYFFTNRTASAGRTLRINSDQSVPSYYFAIAGIGYANPDTIFGTDIPAGSTNYTTPDGLVTLSAYSDTPGVTPASFNETINSGLDWLGILGGKTDQAIEGTESLNLQFSSTVGLSGLGTRYSGGNIILSGFTSDPGLVGPTGLPISGSTYANGTLTVPVSGVWHASEFVVRFTNPGASAGQTLSLHTDGSSGAQLTLAQLNYAAAPVELTITAIPGNQVVLTWPTGTLQQSSTVSGGYTPVTGATSPYTNVISGTQTFFRVKVQ